MARIRIDSNEWTWTRFYSFLGGILFATSDALLALDRFVMPLVHSQILVMATYYAAQLMIALSVVDSREDTEMNFRVIQETDIIKLIQEHGKLLSQVHRDEMFASLSAKRASITQTVANTQIVTILMEKKVRLGQHIVLLLHRTPVVFLIRSNGHAEQIPISHSNEFSREKLDWSSHETDEPCTDSTLLLPCT